MPKPSSSASALADTRRHVQLKPERATNVSSTDYPGHYPGEDNSWNLKEFKKRLKVDLRRLSNRSVEFDIVGVDASVANALRRILIAEVPTIAIENVYVWNNTSVIQDEVLAHRLGLIPLNVDPTLMEMRDALNDIATDRNTMVFRLEIACERAPKPKESKDSKKASSSSTLPSSSTRKPGEDPPYAYANAINPASVDPSTPSKHPALGPSPSPYINEFVYARHLTWVPQGEQEEAFAKRPRPGPTNGDIVLAKLRPGQEIIMDLHAVKGVGKEHAKWCPVATASYRIHPLIKLNPDKPVPPEDAEEFQACFSPGVIHVDPITKAISTDLESMRKDTVSREVLRHPKFEGCVELARLRDHFIFTVESESAYAPETLLPEAIKVMRSKIAVMKAAAEALGGVYGVEESSSAVVPGDGDVEMADA